MAMFGDAAMGIFGPRSDGSTAGAYSGSPLDVKFRVVRAAQILQAPVVESTVNYWLSLVGSGGATPFSAGQGFNDYANSLLTAAAATNGGAALGSLAAFTSTQISVDGPAVGAPPNVQFTSYNSVGVTVPRATFGGISDGRTASFSYDGRGVSSWGAPAVLPIILTNEPGGAGYFQLMPFRAAQTGALTLAARGPAQTIVLDNDNHNSVVGAAAATATYYIWLRGGTAASTGLQQWYDMPIGCTVRFVVKDMTFDATGGATTLAFVLPAATTSTTGTVKGAITAGGVATGRDSKQWPGAAGTVLSFVSIAGAAMTGQLNAVIEIRRESATGISYDATFTRWAPAGAVNTADLSGQFVPNLAGAAPVP